MMIRILTLTAFFALSLMPAIGQTKAEADSAYQQKDYARAAQIYEHILTHGEDAFVYYNLGNCYYRMHDMAHAVLNYERALLREPSNSDIRFNLALARSKTQDKMADTDQFFIFYWARSLINAHNTDGWARGAVLSFGLLLVVAFLRLFFRQRYIQLLAPYVGAALLVMVILFNVFAYVQHGEYLDKTHAIVMKTTDVRSTPDTSGTTVFALHPGTKVKIIDDTMGRWKQIRLSDGKQGWIIKDDIELI